MRFIEVSKGCYVDAEQVSMINIFEQSVCIKIANSGDDFIKVEGNFRQAWISYVGSSYSLPTPLNTVD